MTEQEWLECDKPKPMLRFLHGKASNRKLRLFVAACCRRTWHLLTDEVSRHSVEVAELFADGQATSEELSVANRSLLEAASQIFGKVSQKAAERSQHVAWFCSIDDRHLSNVVQQSLRRFIVPHPGLLRDIFGNPFRPVVFDPAWRTPSVVAVAQTIYDERRFEDMPVLADALEEAGCTAQELLDHCRNGKEHVKGCWAVDLVLGKS